MQVEAESTWSAQVEACRLGGDMEGVVRALRLMGDRGLARLRTQQQQQRAAISSAPGPAWEALMTMSERLAEPALARALVEFLEEEEKQATSVAARTLAHERYLACRARVQPRTVRSRPNTPQWWAISGPF